MYRPWTTVFCAKGVTLAARLPLQKDFFRARRLVVEGTPYVPAHKGNCDPAQRQLPADLSTAKGCRRTSSGSSPLKTTTARLLDATSGLARSVLGGLAAFTGVRRPPAPCASRVSNLASPTEAALHISPEPSMLKPRRSPIFSVGSYGRAGAWPPARLRGGRWSGFGALSRSRLEEAIFLRPPAVPHNSVRTHRSYRRPFARLCDDVHCREDCHKPQVSTV
ncbi:hypothetical protein C2E23DRAFT_48672 [Lenzites betulinus]|nr:hypothetical protein C2E23DRAFT_48672 [Lenzites betulinus]